MAIVYLGLGSNIGDREENIREALRKLGARAVVVRHMSSLYQTKPVGGPPQGDYINAVVKVITALAPEQLLGEIKGIEFGMGRTTAPRNAPRIIDIDILLCDELTLKTEGLEIPHPRMHERSFVLKGMAEIAPDVVHPVFRKSMRELYEELPGS
ncbi:MAG: 2-amino-4-hydroxy-6-hydroxymethyldihydropteridine diphosphokinase [Candidatus Omnitrophica bacterium]|nr:2-amino-4-hydroxy-6-hydroxymethyldihydropteridine diphosphokinase [Candidatus Omnitrophota bacterium]MDD4013086.1 2-amino-4-hydroxy-6-hydroxymethyldihydropteridine diphosphokinase [Candidatus Omnitrophota bacterium]